MTKILGISGSLRERSYNTALLRAAAELAPPDAEIELFDLVAIPLYNDDVESAGDPAPVAELRAAVAEADALLLATPEYNRGTSGVLKNAIDWLSRPALASVLRWKPVAIMGASSGRGGTRRAQQQVRDALLFPGAIVLEQPEVAVPIAWERFDPDLQLVGREHRRRGDRVAVRTRRAGSSDHLSRPKAPTRRRRPRGRGGFAGGPSDAPVGSTALRPSAISPLARRWISTARRRMSRSAR